jgi:hypothetical protein
LTLGFVCAVQSAGAKDRWTELNIGPFYVDTDADVSDARHDLNQLEQLRWVLGGLLETQDLEPLWPFRLLLTEKNEKTSPNGFVWQDGQWLLVTSPKGPLPLGQAAGILLDDNTPRLPAEVESGLRQLFSTLDAHGSHVSWGGAPPHPDLDWARMQMLATRFEYEASFHIFLTALKTGSSLRVAEQNAFGKTYDQIEHEAEANLAKGSWEAVSASGRPLDARRDLGEHSLESDIAEHYVLEFERPEPETPPGHTTGPELVASAKDLPSSEALPLLKKAAGMNSRWAEPIFLQAQLASNPAQKEALLKKAVDLAPRETRYWLELAKLQTARGEETAAQNTWLGAEDSAPTASERERIHQQRLDSQQQLEDAADAARHRDREAVHLADEQAQESALDRIRAAEERANRAVDAQAGAKPESAVPWETVASNKKAQGLLVRVDCYRHGARLSIKTGGGVLELLLPENAGAKLACGVQTAPHRVSATYTATADEEHNTSGTVTSLEVR